MPQLEISQNGVRSVDAPLLEAANMGADGILGVDSLRSQRVLFDFTARGYFDRPVGRKRRAGRGRDDRRRRQALKRGHLIVTSATANSVPMTVVLDTGSEITLGNAALRASLDGARRLGQGRSGSR